MKSATSEPITRRTQSSKKLVPAQSESVYLLEKNLNSLKRQFLDLEVKLKQPRPATFNPRPVEPRSVLYEINAKLFKEKENLEKKALSTMCEKARLEEKMSDVKFKNQVLNHELEIEHSVNKRILDENFEMKQSLEAAEIENTVLASKLTDLKADVELIEEIEAQKCVKLLKVTEELEKANERNRHLQKRVEDLEADALISKMSIDQLTKDRLDLNSKWISLDAKLAEKEKQIGFLSADNERLEKQLFQSKMAHELLDKHHSRLETEKNDLLDSLAKAYRTETELMGDIAVLKARVSILESKNEEYVEQLWRFTR